MCNECRIARGGVVNIQTVTYHCRTSKRRHAEQEGRTEREKKIRPRYDIVKLRLLLVLLVLREGLYKAAEEDEEAGGGGGEVYVCALGEESGVTQCWPNGADLQLYSGLDCCHAAVLNHGTTVYIQFKISTNIVCVHSIILPVD